MTHISILDDATLLMNDLGWQPLNDIASFERYSFTSPEQVLERAKNAQILIVNKTKIHRDLLVQLPLLKCICVSATGYNNIDLSATNELGIIVCNVAGYAADSAAQHVFALLMQFTNRVPEHHQSVLTGDWAKVNDFCYTVAPLIGLKNKTLGILGLGQIGQQVATIALAFGMKVLATHKYPERDKQEGVQFVDWNTLLQESDFVSLHAPLNETTKEIMNKNSLSQMKSTAYLINTGRGGLINEMDLKKALESKVIAGAALDVLSEEPAKNGNILMGVKNCIITPHIAWANHQSRKLLRDEVVNNIQAFLVGKPQNVVT